MYLAIIHVISIRKKSAISQLNNPLPGVKKKAHIWQIRARRTPTYPQQAARTYHGYDACARARSTNIGRWTPSSCHASNNTQLSPGVITLLSSPRLSLHHLYPRHAKPTPASADRHCRIK